MTIRVLLVDDHLEVRERLRILLLQEPDIELMGEAGDGAEALDMLERLPADVVVMDLNLPETSGIETAQRILAGKSGVRVVIISMQSDPHYVKQGFKSRGDRLPAQGLCLRGAGGGRPHRSGRRLVRQPRDRDRGAVGGFRNVPEKNQGFERPKSGFSRFTPIGHRNYVPYLKLHKSKFKKQFLILSKIFSF